MTVSGLVKFIFKWKNKLLFNLNDDNIDNISIKTISTIYI